MAACRRAASAAMDSPRASVSDRVSVAAATMSATSGSTRDTDGMPHRRIAVSAASGGRLGRRSARNSARTVALLAFAALRRARAALAAFLAQARTFRACPLKSCQEKSTGAASDFLATRCLSLWKLPELWTHSARPRAPWKPQNGFHSSHSILPLLPFQEGADDGRRRFRGNEPLQFAAKDAAMSVRAFGSCAGAIRKTRRRPGHHVRQFFRAAYRQS